MSDLEKIGDANALACKSIDTLIGKTSEQKYSKRFTKFLEFFEENNVRLRQMGRKWMMA
jgi:hypothetical protein